MPKNRPSIGTRLRLFTIPLFILSALTVPLALAACDTAGADATPAGPRSGEVVFARSCNVCHPGGGFGSGPSLIQAMPGVSDDAFRNMVRHGKNRMPGFSTSDISDPELENLLTYVRGLK